MLYFPPKRILQQWFMQNLGGKQSALWGNWEIETAIGLLIKNQELVMMAQ